MSKNLDNANVSERSGNLGAPVQGNRPVALNFRPVEKTHGMPASSPCKRARPPRSRARAVRRLWGTCVIINALQKTVRGPGTVGRRATLDRNRVKFIVGDGIYLFRSATTGRRGRDSYEGQGVVTVVKGCKGFPSPLRIFFLMVFNYRVPTYYRYTRCL